MTVSRLIILKTRNISDKNCIEIRKTHVIFNNIFPKIVLFVR